MATTLFGKMLSAGKMTDPTKNNNRNIRNCNIARTIFMRRKSSGTAWGKFYLIAASKAAKRRSRSYCCVARSLAFRNSRHGPGGKAVVLIGAAQAELRREKLSGEAQRLGPARKACSSEVRADCLRSA